MGLKYKIGINSLVAIIIAAVSFSIYPLLSVIALNTVSTYQLAFIVQILIAIITFCLMAINQGSLSRTKEIFASFWKLPWNLKIIPLLSGTGIFAGGLFFVSSLQLMNKTGATLIMECWPLMAIVLSRALLTHKKWEAFSFIDLILIIIALIGLVLITVGESGTTFNDFFSSSLLTIDYNNIDQLWGILLAVLSAVCFAWAGVSRSYFSSRLPQEFRIRFFKKTDTLAESIFTYMLTIILGLPAAFISYYLFDTTPLNFEISSMAMLILIASSLVITSMFYSYAILIADNANINLLWYIAPLLATVWLILFGYSYLTPLIILGGILIILANLILILTSKKKKGIDNEHASIH